MKVTLNSRNLDNIKQALDKANANVKTPNEFVYCQAVGDKIKITLMVNQEEVLTIQKYEVPCFNYLDHFVGKIDFDKKELEIFTFADLHTHTEYSILDGANRIKDLSKKYSYYGAITDHGVMYGCVDFYKKMHDLHKHPILGFEAYTDSWQSFTFLSSNLSDEEKSKLRLEQKNAKFHLILLAKNETGYSNLVKLCSYGQANKGGKFPLKPRVSYEELIKHKEGIVVLSACIAGELPQLIIKDEIDIARKMISFFKSEFGDDYYLEIQKHASESRVNQFIDELSFELGQTIKYDEVIQNYQDVKNGKITLKDFKVKYSNKLYREVELLVQEEIVNENLIDLAEEMGVKIVATTDAHYLNEEDAEFHEALLCNQTKTTLNNPNHFSFAGEGYYIHTIDEMEKLYSDNPMALINTLEVAEKCNFSFKFGEYKLPKFPIPNGYTDKEYLTKLSLDGFEERFAHLEATKKQEYKNRLEFELNTIFKMGYQGYFFIVWDYIKYAKDHGIYVGPGRGSGAGSIVLYCLHITENLDPIKYDLLFERFLNPDRISMPDIDVDFEYELRETVIDYCKQKYGEQCVSRIITFGTMAAKGAVLDMARVLEYPVTLARKINEQIPSAPGMTIKKAMLENVQLNNMYNNDVDVKVILDLAMKVEGLIKNTSCHACGVIIAPDDVTNFCPQTFAYDEETKTYERTTQYTMGECEEIGLLKMDFLGLRTESVIKESVTDIAKYYGVQLNIYDNNSIRMDDIKVYEMLGKGLTTGVFQLESAGITGVIMDLYNDISDKVKEIENNPILTEEGKNLEKTQLGEQCFERLIAGISLYRPGPMDEIPNYIKGIEDEKNVHYDCPQLEPILKNTYGVLVYQEQVMLAVRALANFTPGQADTIRKAMGKKKQEILDEYKPYFINGSGQEIDSHSNQPYNIKGCVENGIDSVVAETIWGKMESFAKYAFNKSHAAAYAVVSIQTAWLAYYYPVIFLKANLNVYKGNPDKLRFYLGYCGREGIKILPPSVNKSDYNFTLNDDASAIIFGLSGIKNVGKFAKNIIDERNARGEFTTFQNFLERMLKNQGLNSRAVESLAKVGAFDCFGGSRLSKVEYIKTMVEIVKSDKSISMPGQNTIYELGEEVNLTSNMIELKDIEIPNSNVEYGKDEFLTLEEEYAGFYLTEHPLDEYKDIMISNNCKDISIIKDKGNELHEKEVMKQQTIVGIISTVTKRFDKNNKPFATFTLKDITGDISVIAWSNVMETSGEFVSDNEKVLLIGNVTKGDFGVQMTATSITSLDEIKNDIIGLNLLAFEDIDLARKQYIDVMNICKNQPKGSMQINFIKEKEIYKIADCNWSMELFNKLREICTEENVKYVYGNK